MTNQKPRYEIGNQDLEILIRELNEAVENEEYPKYDPQFNTPSNRKTYVITRKACLLPAKLFEYPRRN